MEVESFEDEEVAKLLNDWFVSIKVGRSCSPLVICDDIFFYVATFYHGRTSCDVVILFYIILTCQ